MISVVNITNRPGGLDILKDNLDKQSFQDFELIICDGLYDWRKEEVQKYFNTFPALHIPEPQKKDGDVWNLNKAHNEALRQSRGEIIVFLQDYIWIPGNGLEKFSELVKEHVAVSGVGHKAKHPNTEDNLQGKISIWNKPFMEVPNGIAESDIRIDGVKEIVESKHSQFELNWSAVPKQGLVDIGGFDEKYDRGYSCENFNISFRLSLIDYEFLLDKTNECVGFNQQALFPRPEDWEERHNRYGRHQETIKAILDKKKPYKLNYL